MIQGVKQEDLSKENILSKITEYDILRAYWPSSHELKLNRAICSPFRKDDNPSFIIGTKFNCITYKDLGDSNYRGDIWKFVQQIGGFSTFMDVLKDIDNKFNLGFSRSRKINKSPVIIDWKQPIIEPINPPDIKIVTRKFTSLELKYWNDYYQDISDLKRENIYVPKQIWRNGKRVPLLKDELVFCFYYPDICKWKIYRPFAPKRTKNTPFWKWKWDTNLPFNYIENYDGIKCCSLGIINKSKKDRMVLFKALEITEIWSVQAEDSACLSEDALSYFKNNTEEGRRIIVSDNDNKGKQFSWWLTKEHGFRHCNVPDKLRDQFGHTDFADWAKGDSLDAVKQHFIKKRIIC